MVLKMKKKFNYDTFILPTTSQLEKELYREKYNSRYKKLLKSTFYTLIVVFALSILVATLFFQVLQTYGNSMEPTLNEGEIVVCVKTKKFKQNDIIAFYYNNRILIKRIVATSSQWVNIDEDGNVYINNQLIEENYITKKVQGDVDIDLPYQVQENSYFVLGDKRESSIDSRNSLIGTVSQENIIGKVVLRVWPIKDIKIFN